MKNDIILKLIYGQVVHTYEGTGSFGELALMYNMPRAASVRAQTPGALWAMDRHTFRRILLKSAFKKRKLYEELLDKVPMLKALQVTRIFLFYWNIKIRRLTLKLFGDVYISRLYKIIRLYKSPTSMEYLLLLKGAPYLTVNHLGVDDDKTPHSIV